jgi:hypothetical protein
MQEWAEWSSQGIQDLAIVTIVVSIIFGSLRSLLQLSTRVADPYRAYKELLGRSLLLSLEFLMAADIIRTVLLDETIKEHRHTRRVGCDSNVDQLVRGSRGRRPLAMVPGGSEWGTTSKTGRLWKTCLRFCGTT